MVGIGAAFWVCVAALIFAAMPAKAQGTFSATVGVDYWAVEGGPARYLPDYSTPHEWKDTAAWTKAKAQYGLMTDLGPLVLTAQGQYHEVQGGRIDRLDADLRLNGGYGLRAGVLPYRISWCRTHSDQSPWMAEPDAFCRFSGLNEISQGAFGVQAYHGAVVGGWMIDVMPGIYRPLIDGQNDKLGPYVEVGPNVSHEAYGVSANALHLGTGVQARLGWLNTKQVQNDASGSKTAYQRRLDYDSYYLGLEGNLTRQIDLRASMSGYVGNQTNEANPYKWNGKSTTLEVSYKIAPGHYLSYGASVYENRTFYFLQKINKQFVRVKSESVAWRFDLPDGWWGVLQWSRTDDDSITRQGKQTLRDGRATGLRIAKSF